MGNLSPAFKAVIAINILHLEDNDEDALLVERALRKAGYAFSLRRARNKPQFVAQLAAKPDLILSDFHLPDFDALGALDRLKDRGLDVPFILVSGAARDEDVLEAMKRGAADFLFKDRLVRLGAAISAALEYRALRQQARETQLALERNREELDYAFGNAAIGMALTSLDSRWLKVNQALCTTLGYNESELLATDCHSVTAPDDIAEDIELTRRLTDGEVSSTQREKRYLHKGGHMVWVQVTASLVRGRDGAPRYRMLQVLDISHRVEAEKRFQATFEQAAVGLAHTTAAGRFLAVNDKLCELLGYTRDELMRTTTLELSHPDARGEHAQLYQEVMDGKHPRFSAEKQWVRKDGTVIWINRTVSRSDSAMGPETYLIQVIEDITERKRAEQALQQSQQSYESLVASLDSIVWEADAQTYRFLFVSRQAERLLGYPVERWIDEPTFWQDHIHPDDRDWAIAYCVKATSELRSHDFEYRMIAADGRVVWLRDIVSVTVENGRPRLSRGIMVDTTAARQAQALSERLIRARRVLADCSRALVHAREERGLLNEMCRIVVESGGYVQSHIGFSENDARKTVRPVASAGYEPGYLEARTLSWAGGGHQGLTGQAIAAGECYISRDIATDPNSRHLVERARQRGYRSMIGLPLKIEGHCIGAISIYAREKDAFDDEEVALLTTLADDIAFGIGSLRRDAARREAESRLERLTRARKVMAECNRVVMHAENEAGLMQEICRLAIEAGGYRQAWIGLKTEDAVAGVRAVVHAGYGSDNAPMIGASNWGDDGRYRGLASEALASGEACIARDILNDPAQERKRRRAIDLEYQSSISLPLKEAGGVFGALTLHAAEKDAFDEEEFNLLIELAADVSFGITSIRTRDAHREAERRLRESEQRFRETFEQAAVGITRVDLTGVLVDANQKFCDMLGYSRGELLGKAMRDITHPADYGRGAQYRAQLEHGVMKSTAGEKRFLRKDGTILWARRTLSTACDEGGKPQYVINVVEDITESKRGEAERARLAAIVESSNDAIISRGLDQTILTWNSAAERLFGWTAQEAIGHSIHLIVPPERIGENAPYRDKVHEGLPVPEYDTVRFAKDGKHTHVSLSQSPIRNDGGEVIAVSLILRDITDRKAAEERYRATFDNAPVGIMHTEVGGYRILRANRKLCEMLGYTREEMLALTSLDITPREERAATIDYNERMSRGEIRNYSREKRYVRKDGQVIWTNISLSTVSGADGRATHVISVIQDINDRKRAEAALRESEEQFRQLANNIPQVFWITDVSHKRTLYVSPAAESMIGLPLHAIHAAPRALVRAVHVEDRARVRAARKDAAAGGYDQTYRVVRPDGSIRWVHDRAFPVHDESGRVYRIAGIAEDVTDRKRAEERLLQLAHYDVLTSLPNRVLFYDRLKQVLAQARRNQWIVGVMFIDVDRFKNVNDTLGHSVGDQLLQQVSERLTHAVRTGDTVGRLGGDEFAVVLSNLASAQDASLVAQKVMASFHDPFRLEDAEIYVTASIGITLYPDDSADQDALIRNADAAMYRAKEVGRNSYQFYTPEMNQRALEILNMESSLRRALERNEFLLYFQPKSRIADGETVGVEALLRWQHPERGLVSPAAFMPVLEETGLIVPVGEWVLKAVCAQIKAWEPAGIKPVPVAVNLSARQFGARDLGPTIRRILEEHRVDPSLIELEITESSLMANTEEAVRTLEYLEALGVDLSIDDFGTGYSSLGYLKRFPLTSLKIDRSFVRDITADADDATITRAVISMAHSLGLKVIAEGVETEAQLAFLAEYGCDEIQGYYFSRPLPADECGVWLAERRCLRRAPQVPETAPVVLLVDDDDDALILLKRSLDKDGYRILAARNAHEALDVLSRQHVDVVISDQSMPGVPGVEFLQRVKQLSPRTVRMMTSGHTDFQMVADAVNKGEIFRFLPKSMKEEQLRGDVREALQAKARSGQDGHFAAPGTAEK
ncbi:MAG: PAS domain S-box protein [Betaproteobacteria bacterium]|nr:PAS domain S-box protein [Betaproteobacteria bacterium]